MAAIHHQDAWRLLPLAFPAMKPPDFQPGPAMTTTDIAEAATAQAALLSAALPYMQRYENKTVVVKYGGHAMGDAALGQAFARDIALAQAIRRQSDRRAWRGPADRRRCWPRWASNRKFEGGLARHRRRRPSRSSRWCCAGSINKEIVALINAEGEWAIGLCGKDGNMVFAEKAHKTVTDPDSNIERVLDLGFVGEPVEVDRTLLDLLARSEMIPVLAPVAPGPRRPYLQHQCRHLRRRHRRSAEGDAPAVPDRRARRARQGQETDRRIDRCGGEGLDPRRHHLGRHDPQGRNLHRGDRAAASRASSSSTARRRMRSCWSCSPSMARAR